MLTHISRKQTTRTLSHLLKVVGVWTNSCEILYFSALNFVDWLPCSCWWWALGLLRFVQAKHLLLTHDEHVELAVGHKLQWPWRSPGWFSYRQFQPGCISSFNDCAIWGAHPLTQMLHGAGIFTYIYHKNGPNVGKYSSTMEHLTNIIVAYCKYPPHFVNDVSVSPLWVVATAIRARWYPPVMYGSLCYHRSYNRKPEYIANYRL